MPELLKADTKSSLHQTH